MKVNEIVNSGIARDLYAYSRLTHIGLPTKKSEKYRHFDIADLLKKEYVTVSNCEVSAYQKNTQYATIFIKNGVLDTKNSDLSDSIEYQNGAKKEIETDNSLYYLGELLSDNEPRLIIKANTHKPIKIINQYAGEHFYAPSHLDICLQKGVSADIVEVFDDASLQDSLVIINRVFSLESESKLSYTKLQNLKTSNNMVVNYLPKMQSDAQCNFTAVDLGCKTAFSDFDVQLDAEQSAFNFAGIIKTNKKQKTANMAGLHHTKEHTTSSFICKHILSDEASALFQVRSTVEENAKFSKTFQNSQTILLDNGPRINAIPQLILHTDELEAAHGATSGSLDTEALYYLMSRGIDEQTASNMLIKAIELQVIETITNTQIQELALDFLQR